MEPQQASTLTAIASAIVPIFVAIVTAVAAMPKRRAEAHEAEAGADETVSSHYLAWAQEFRDRVVNLERHVATLDAEIVRLRLLNVRLMVHNQLLWQQVEGLGEQPVDPPDLDLASHLADPGG